MMCHSVSLTPSCRGLNMPYRQFIGPTSLAATDIVNSLLVLMLVATGTSRTHGLGPHTTYALFPYILPQSRVRSLALPAHVVGVGT